MEIKNNIDQDIIGLNKCWDDSYRTKTQKKVDRIVWFIPFRKLRDKLRNYLVDTIYNAQITKELKEYSSPESKYSFNSIKIRLDNAELDKKNTELVKKILINEEDNGQYILHNYFINNTSNGIDKPFRYFDLYERYFSKFKGRDVNILEIGVQNGGSTQMWEYYFKKINPGFKINIFGLDIDKRCKSIENENIKIFIGSQSDRDFLRKLKSVIPKLDILIDDGGHRMHEQIITFEEMYEHIKDDGLYWCEDTGTSYRSGFYGGGYKSPNSYIEYTKNLIDYINAYNALKSDELEVSNFTDTAYGIYFHENVVVVEKKIRNPIYNNIAASAIIGKKLVK
ncbi:class I SAM-dependent methyltransferase [uncultured Brachyspira sp.]|uniref:class I SAM-dependent methyltransferase n=1 Tax=uncultured Brachyspira sp. TaxID=221953 RepID=UPI0025CC9F11|nr:class I SAM-dependent methyltransferase [uncultured Brachyspira sp.]